MGCEWCLFGLWVGAVLCGDCRVLDVVEVGWVVFGVDGVGLGFIGGGVGGEVWG